MLTLIFALICICMIVYVCGAFAIVVMSYYEKMDNENQENKKQNKEKH